MAPKAFLVCLIILAIAFVEAGKHPKATKIKKGKNKDHFCNPLKLVGINNEYFWFGEIEFLGANEIFPPKHTRDNIAKGFHVFITTWSLHFIATV